jgi:hypothetical protein
MLTPPPFSDVESQPDARWDSAEFPAGAAGGIGLPGAGPDSALGRARVLIASQDPLVMKRLLPWLGSDAKLEPLTGLRDLMRRLDELSRERVAIVLDCRRPSIRPTALAALADELPPAFSVVLWGATPEQERGILAVSPSVNRWILLAAATRSRELAARCAKLVG